MQGPLFRMSRSPEVLAWTGRETGTDQDEVLAELGIDAAERERLRGEGAW